ncbi:MAG: FG-GAP repeat domain-containing protein, partial [Chitinophagaceae bacterium]
MSKLHFCLFYFFILFLASCSNNTPLFKKVSSAASGILFNNTIKETDSINVLDFENIYNGGGVGIGDFNNDGLQDIYFTGNMVSNKLYLNKGQLKFNDVTKIAGVDGKGRWCRGVAVVDINNDGWQDLYVCTSIKKNVEERQNILYINQGLDKNKVTVFKEMAAEYGLNDTTHSTMATFFDYDNDGDLDVYIVANQIIHGDYPNRFRPRIINGEHPSTGRLYRNDWSDSLKHPFFTDVSKQAGITIEGYGHNAAIT